MNLVVNENPLFFGATKSTCDKDKVKLEIGFYQYTSWEKEYVTPVQTTATFSHNGESFKTELKRNNGKVKILNNNNPTHEEPAASRSYYIDPNRYDSLEKVKDYINKNVKNWDGVSYNSSTKNCYHYTNDLTAEFIGLSLIDVENKHNGALNELKNANSGWFRRTPKPSKTSTATTSGSWTCVIL